MFKRERHHYLLGLNSEEQSSLRNDQIPMNSMRQRHIETVTRKRKIRFRLLDGGHPVR